jgi:hypothetical protein
MNFFEKIDSCGISKLSIYQFEMISRWIDNIGEKDLLWWSPRGFLAGCGETSQYMSYFFRHRPSKEQFKKEAMCNYYYMNYQGDEQVKISANDIESIIDEIDRQLNKRGYVRVSFIDPSDSGYDDGSSITSSDAISSDIIGVIKNYRSISHNIEMFDHSFVIIGGHDSMIKRIESYIGVHDPRIIDWPTYKTDLKDILNSDPLPAKEAWNRVFEVQVKHESNGKDISILLEN